MTDIQVGFAGIAILLTLIALRVPIAIALISVSFVGISTLVSFKTALGALGVIPYSFTATWHLSSIPMFVLMGFFCYRRADPGPVQSRPDVAIRPTRRAGRSRSSGMRGFCCGYRLLDRLRRLDGAYRRARDDALSL